MRPAPRARRPASTAVAHRRAPSHRVLRAGDRRGGHHRVAAELHRERRVRGGADAGVEHDRHARRPRGSARCCTGCGCPCRCRSASRAASPRRSRRPRAGARAPGRRSCTGARRSPRRPAARRRRSSSGASGSSVSSSPITSSLIQSVSNASRARRAVSTASRAVWQPAVFGSSSTPASAEHVDQRAARRRRVDPPQGDRHELASARGDRLGRAAPARGSRRCRAAAASAACARRSQLIVGRRAAARAVSPVAASVVVAHRAIILPASPVSTSTRASSASANDSQSRARHDLAVDRDGDPARVGREGPAREHRGDRLAGATSDSLAVEHDHAQHRLAARRRAGDGAASADASRREAPRIAAPSSASSGCSPASSRATSSRRQRREQDAVAVVAGRPDQAVERAAGRSPARCRACPGAGPTHSSSIFSSLTPGTSSCASRSSS